MLMRLGLLAVISWILKLDKTLFTAFEIDFSGKGLILVAGGLFLIYKSTKEIYHKTETADTPDLPVKNGSFARLLTEVIILDLVFSIDSIITAVGMVQELWVMYTAVIVTVFIMLIASKPISEFIRKHPSFKILALCFLMTVSYTHLDVYKRQSLGRLAQRCCKHQLPGQHCKKCRQAGKTHWRS